MLFKAFRALSSGTRERDRILEDPYLDRPASRRRATGPAATHNALQEPLNFDNLHISESDSDEYGLPQATRKSSFPRQDAHRRNISREQAEIEYKCQGCGEQYRVTPPDTLQPCKYCHVRPVDPRRRHPNRPQIGPLPSRQIRTPGHLEESFRSLYFRLGVVLHDEELEKRPPHSPRLQEPNGNGQRSPMLSVSPPKAGPSQAPPSRSPRLEPPWSPKQTPNGNVPVSHTPPSRVPPPVPAAPDTPRLGPGPPSNIRQSRSPAIGENGFLTTPHHTNRPISRGSPMVNSPASTSPRKRMTRMPPPMNGTKVTHLTLDPKTRAKNQLLESFRAEFRSLYGNVDFLNNDFCSSVRPKITKRSLSEGSNISLKSHENCEGRMGVQRNDSAKPSALRFDVHDTFRPTPTLQPVIPDSKALLAGHLHDVVSSIVADYSEARQIERSTTARKSTYQTSPHVNYAELHAYHSILARFTLDVKYCLILVTREEDSSEKREAFKDEVITFAAQVLVCCLDVMFELLSRLEKSLAPLKEHDIY